MFKLLMDEHEEEEEGWRSRTRPLPPRIRNGNIVRLIQLIYECSADLYGVARCHSIGVNTMNLLINRRSLLPCCRVAASLSMP